ncbi:hypothetical protein GCM10008090_15520 [Arenicella chitinivorans]|uniref:FHA domain-containing protein n=1 Tax=Arenicella chitinivorans TaxID=1329800 RepID=A0A918VLR4_9GAMM|nr:FHA domain-containing protein [Arenicella chitinivorans]GHA06746.1 hypothetical protein GCM10008090_15520 [Arenicella chitinivorans]
MGYIRVYCGNELKTQLELGEERITLGRVDDNTIVLPDPGVSRVHAAIEYQDGDYYVVDLESQNGVFLNNEKVNREKLKYWDEIQIHNFVIKFMAKAGIGATNDQDLDASQSVASDKTEFYNLTDKTELDKLRQKTKQCYVTYKTASGEPQKLLIQKPRTIIGGGKNADIKTSGWFAPAIAATIERQGSSYELVPHKRGNAIFQNKQVVDPVKLIDGSGFIVRDIEFEFFNRLD